MNTALAAKPAASESKSVSSKALPAVDPTDLDKQHILGGHRKNDHWLYVPGRNVLIRVHNTARKSLYVPTKSTCPVPLEHLLPERKTEFQLETGEPDMIEDRWTDKNVAPIEKPWTGRTQFTITDSPAAPVPILDRTVPSSSSSRGKKKDDKDADDLPVVIQEDESQDNKEPKDSDPFTDPPPSLPIALARIHKRLSNKKELLKLRVKHHHMSYEQFKY